MMCIRVVKVRGFASPAEQAKVCYVGRACFGWPAHPLCNPAKLSVYANRAQCLAHYTTHLAKMPDLEAKLLALWEECQHGVLPLACWCVEDTVRPGTAKPLTESPHIVCHAQVLAHALANRFVDPLGDEPAGVP